MIRGTSEAKSPQGIGCGGGTAIWLKNASASLPSGDINEDTLETENAAAAAAAAFTASTDLKEAVLGRSALSIAPSATPVCHSLVLVSDGTVQALLCRAAGAPGCSLVGLGDALPRVPGVLSQHPRGSVTSRELAVAGWAAAALSWSGMSPCVWPPLAPAIPACQGDVSLAATCWLWLPVKASLGSKDWASGDLKPVML